MALFFIAVILAFIGRPLLGQGVLLPTDIMQPLPPWNADDPLDFEPHNWILGDTLDLHAHLVANLSDAQDKGIRLWEDRMGAGQPTYVFTMSPFDIPYLLTPEWYAPAMAVALKMATAMVLSYGFLRALGAARWASATGGVAYSLSGFFVAWMSFPHTRVSTLIPGLFWAAEIAWRRLSLRSVAWLALVMGAMVFGSYPAVLLFSLLGVAIYLVVRSSVSLRQRSLGQHARAVACVLAAGVLGAVIGAAHLMPFFELLEQIDLGYKSQPPGAHLDAKFLLTMISPNAYGNHHGGPSWFADANYPEAQTYTGVSVITLAGLALMLPKRREGGSSPPRGAVFGLLAVVIVVGLIMFTGGPFNRLAQQLPFFSINRLGRVGRPVFQFGLAMLAGLGANAAHLRLVRVTAAERGLPALAVKFGLMLAFPTVLVASVWPYLDQYLDQLAAEGLRRWAAREYIITLGAGVLTAAIVLVSSRLQRPKRSMGLLTIGLPLVIALDMLIFAIPVYAVTTVDDYYPVTPGHEFLAENLGPTYRMGGSQWVFYPNSNEVYAIRDFRGHILHQPGYRELLATIAPQAFSRGTPTNVYFSPEARLGSPVLDTIGVRYWAEDLKLPVRGRRVTARPPSPEPLIIDGPFSTEITVPDGGVRAIEMLLQSRVRSDEQLTMSVRDSAGDLLAESQRQLGDLVPGEWVAFPVVGEEWIPESVITVTVAPAPGTSAAWRTTEGGGPAIRVVVGQDDGLRLAFADGVVIYERLHAQGLVRFFPGYELTNRTEAVRRLASIPSSLRRTALLNSRPASLEPGPADQTGVATLRRRDDDQIEILVESPVPGVVVVAQSLYPGWEARIDGRPVEIIPADVAFQGVVVPAGRHIVEMMFSPPSLRFGLLLSAVGLAVAALLLVRSRSTTGHRRSGPDPTKVSVAVDRAHG